MEPTPEQVEAVAHVLAERFDGVTLRDPSDPVDVSRIHREIADDVLAALSAAEKEREGETRALAEQIAEAMAEHANRDRYVLEHGWQSTGVEPPEYDRSDYEDIAQFIADRVQPREGDIIEKLREWAKAEHDATVGWDAMGTRAVTLLLARLDTFLNDLQEQSTPKEEACGQVGVGHGGDTWDPVCDLPAGHAGRCNWSGEPAQEQSTGEEQ